MAQPNLHSWAEAEEPLHLIERETAKADEEPKALCCYGLLRKDNEQMLLRFVAGQAVSAVTIAFLEWVCTKLAEQGHKTLVIIWDNATWHKSQAVRHWLKAHNQKVREDWREDKYGLRIIPCFLPVKSPWLNPIEPKWLHGKRAVVEAERKLALTELTERVYTHFECEPLAYLTQ